MSAHIDPSTAPTAHPPTRWSPAPDGSPLQPVAAPQSPAAADPTLAAPANPQQSALAAAILGHWGTEDSGRLVSPPSVALPEYRPREVAWNASPVYTAPTPPSVRPEHQEPGDSTATSFDSSKRALTRTSRHVENTADGVSRTDQIRQMLRAEERRFSASQERSEAISTDEGRRIQAQAAALEYGNGTFSFNVTGTRSQDTAGAYQRYLQWGSRIGVKPENGDVSVGGNTAFRGGSATASVVMGANHAGLTMAVGNQMVGGSFTVDRVFGQESQRAIEQSDGSAYAQMFGGHGYLSASRQDAFSIGGSVGVRSVGIGGGVNTESTVEMLAQLPEDWRQQTPAQRTAFEQAQRRRLQGVQGLADVNLTTLDSGAGVRFTMNNGWNAHGGVGLGAVAVQGGGGQSATQQVTIARQGERLRVSLATGNTDSFGGGVAAGPAELSVSQRETDTRRFEFEVDPQDPQALAAMERFMHTGLLPGADQLTGPHAPALESFNNSRQEVDRLNAQLAALRQAGRLDAADEGDQEVSLLSDIDAAQRTLQASRAELNQHLQSRAGVGSDLAPGIRVTSTTTQEDRDTSARIGLSQSLGLDLGGRQQSWVHQQQLSARGSVEHSFGYRDHSSWWLSPTRDQATVANTDPNGMVWRMSSLRRLETDAEVQSVGRIGQRNIPSYVLDAEGRSVSGTTSVAMNQGQVDRMGGYLNNVEHASSRAMWNEFGTRTAAFLRGDMRTLTGASRPDRMVTEMFRLDVAELMIRRSEGGGPETDSRVLAQRFAAVQSPDDFQRLSPQDQQLFVDVLNRTSGLRQNTPENPDPRAATRNPYESVAAILLIQDPAARSEQMRDLFVQIHRESAVRSQDPVTAFTEFAERFRDDPETYSSIQSAISFHWSQPEVEDLLESANPQHNEAYRAAQVTRAATSMVSGASADPLASIIPDQGYHSNHALTALLAANRNGGAPELRRVLGANSPQQFLNGLSDDPVRQHLLYDLLMQAGYANQIAGVQLSFPLTSQ